MIDNEAVHDAHEKERNDEEGRVQEHREDLLQRLIRPHFSTLPATYKSGYNVLELARFVHFQGQPSEHLGMTD